jgi:hypothetical protein
MVYLLETTLLDWDEVPYVSKEFVSKQIQGIALQQSDIPPEPRLRGAFELPDIWLNQQLSEQIHEGQTR